MKSILKKVLKVSAVLGAFGVLSLNFMVANPLEDQSDCAVLCTSVPGVHCTYVVGTGHCWGKNKF